MKFMTKQRKRIFLFFSVVILTTISLMLIFLYLSGPEDIEYRKGQIISGKRAFASVENISFTQSIDNEITFWIRAKRAYIRNRKLGFLRVAFQKVMEMEDVSISFYKKGMEDISIRSDQATLYLGSKDVLFKGNVICSIEDGRTLKTEKLLWDNDLKIFKTAEFYEYTTKDGILITGKGIELDRKLEAIKTRYETKTLAHRGGGK